MKVVKNEPTTSPVYNPNSKYTWKPEDRFELDGNQFGIMLNTFRRVLSSPVADMIFRVDEANREIEKLMTEYVSKGIIKEVTEASEE